MTYTCYYGGLLKKKEGYVVGNVVTETLSSNELFEDIVRASLSDVDTIPFGSDVVGDPDPRTAYYLGEGALHIVGTSGPNEGGEPPIPGSGRPPAPERPRPPQPPKPPTPHP